MADKGPKEVGWTGWFALGGFVLTVICYAERIPVLTPLLALATIVWAITALVRVLRIHRYVRRAAR